MPALLLATAAVVAASAVVGHAVDALCGFARFRFIAAAVGFSALLVVAGSAVQLPGRAGTAAAAVGGLTLAAAAVLARRRGFRRGPLLDAAVVSAVVLAAVSLPFAVSGRIGVLGAGENNDMAVHMKAAFWLQTHVPPPPRLVGAGYPLGPHALAAALATGLHLSIPTAFTALTLAIPVVTALAALAAFPAAARAARVAAAALVGLAYLVAAYYAQGAFKETLEAGLVLAFALSLRRLPEESAAARRGVPIGLLVAGMVWTYSYFGLLWPAAALVALLGLEVALARRAAAGRVARAVPAAAVALVTTAVAVAPQLGRIVTFAGSSYAHEPRAGMGNLPTPVPPLEVLGVWLRGDFRFRPHPFALTLALALLALAALAAALVHALRRRELVLPAALLGALAVYANAALFKNPYNAAKALVVPAPLVAALLASAALEARRRRRAVAVMAVAVALPAAASSVLALRDALVRPMAHARALEALRPLTRHAPTLFLGHDDFVQWDLRGIPLGTVDRLYSTWIVATRPRAPRGLGAPVDFDSVAAAELDRFRYVVTPRTPYASTPPSSFALARRTRWYLLWRRTGRTLPRSILAEDGAPGAVLDCSTGAGRWLSRRRGVAGTLPAPVALGPQAWSGRPSAAGESATLVLTLPRGTWDISLQYVSREGIDVSLPGLRTSLPASLERMGPYWLVGTVRTAARTSLRVRATTRPLTWFGRALGARGETRALGAVVRSPLGGVAATRHGARERVVPLRRACGRYVDWYRVSGATRGGSPS